MPWTFTTNHTSKTKISMQCLSCITFWDWYVKVIFRRVLIFKEYIAYLFMQKEVPQFQLDSWILYLSSTEPIFKLFFFLQINPVWSNWGENWLCAACSRPDLQVVKSNGQKNTTAHEVNIKLPLFPTPPNWSRWRTAADCPWSLSAFQKLQKETL